MNKALQSVVAGVLFLAVFDGRAGTVMDVLRPGSTARHMVFPFYSEPDRKLSIVVRVERAYVDYQRKGFFHIGIMPVAVLDGVTVEVRDAGSAVDAFGQLRRWLDAGNGQRVELRRVKFNFSTNSLEAGVAQCRAGDCWYLSDGVRLVCGGRETRVRRATLQVAGKEAGRVVLEDAPESASIFLGETAKLEH